MNIPKEAIAAPARRLYQSDGLNLWGKAAASIIDEHGNPIKPTNITNPYRSQA